jgi:NADH-quinone oxidoreductase subunit L
MLGVVISNSLLLLFMCWEIVGLTSYLLIGFWYAKPEAAAAAKKAFITTRIGDLGFLLGMVWLYSQSGTLLFYDGGTGCLESSALAHLVAQTTILGLTTSSAIGILIFCGAAGKSGQVPLHVWLPDAMEGPTPVSALIHAATMVAAGVFLIARIYPLMSAHPTALLTPTVALQVVTWVGASTAIFGATIAVAQYDIKRSLAYSTVSQLGYMMMGLGVGGVAVGMFHLITHAFFKALLFMGAGSVIHGCHDEQNIRKMGGLKSDMPLTFVTYAAGMLALCGVPIFAGFWSKDGILEAGSHWSVSKGPVALLIFGALLTAFYMTRQVAYVFFGHWRGHKPAHESPAVMTIPLAILAFFACILGLFGTPAWPWFQGFLDGERTPLKIGTLFESNVLPVMGASIAVVALGIGLAWALYVGKSLKAEAPDVIERAAPLPWTWLRNRLYIDEIYGATFVAFYAWWARVADWLDRRVWGGAVSGVALLFRGWANLNRLLDANVVDGTFDKGCEELSTGGGLLSRIQSGQVQAYLRWLALAVVVLAAILIWSSGA